MEIPQIPIKMNQITQQETGVKEQTGNLSFIDMLLGQISNSSESVPEETHESSNDEFGPLSDEDWLELDTLLSTLLGLLNNPEMHQSTAKMEMSDSSRMNLAESIQAFFSKQNLSDSQSKGTPAEIENQAAFIQEQIIAAVKDLEHWLQKMKGSNQSEFYNVGQMREALAQLSSRQIPSESTGLKEKIKILLDALHGETEGISNEVKQTLSLDKNQIGFYTKPLSKTSVNHNKIMNQTGVEGNESGLKTDQAMVSPVATNPSPSNGEVPKMNVTEFAQKTSEWVKGQHQMSHSKIGTSEARFLLNPEHLGAIEIKISFEQGQISTQILAETAMAKEALEGQLQQLKQSLQLQGFIIQKLEVALQQLTMTGSNQSNLQFSGESSQFSQEQQSQAEQSDENLANKQTDDERREMVMQDQSAFTYGKKTSSVIGASQIDFTA